MHACSAAHDVAETAPGAYILILDKTMARSRNQLIKVLVRLTDYDETRCGRNALADERTRVKRAISPVGAVDTQSKRPRLFVLRGRQGVAGVARFSRGLTVQYGQDRVVRVVESSPLVDARKWRADCEVKDDVIVF